MFLSTLVLGAVVLVTWPPSPSVPSPSPAVKHLQAFFTTWTATRVHPGLFLLPYRLTPAFFGTELTDLNFESETSGSFIVDGNNSSTPTNNMSTTWLVHAFAPFDAAAQRTNALMEKHLRPLLSKRQQHQQHQQCGASSPVRLGKLDVTQHRQAAQDLLDFDENAGVGSVLTVLRLHGDGGGEEEQYHGPRTRQALEQLLDNLEAGESIDSAPVSPVHLKKHGEIQSFLKEHPLAFVLGRAEEGVVAEEEATFTATCEAMGWQHCAVIDSKKALLRAAVASLSESLGGRQRHQGAVIAKLDQGRDALLYQPSSSSSSSSSETASLEKWMVQHGFVPVTHLDLAGPHIQRFVQLGQQGQQQHQQLVVAVVRPFEDSMEEIKVVLDTLQDAARRHPQARFGYVTSAGSKGWPAFVARYFEVKEGGKEGGEQEVVSSSCRLFLLDCLKGALYEEMVGVERLDFLLEEVQAGTRSPPARLLTPRSVEQVEKEEQAEQQQQQQREAVVAAGAGAGAQIEEDVPSVAPEAIRRMMMEGLAGVCVAVLVVCLFMMTPSGGGKEKATAAAATAAATAAGRTEVKREVVEKQQQQQQEEQSLPTIPAYVEDAKARQANRLAMIAETLD